MRKKQVFAAFHSGANAYCLKNIKPQELVNVINSVINGAIWIDPSIASYILQLFHSKTAVNAIKENEHNDFDLTTREMDILKLVALQANQTKKLPMNWYCRYIR